VIVHTLCI